MFQPFPVGNALLRQPGTHGVDEEATGGQAICGGREQAALKAREPGQVIVLSASFALRPSAPPVLAAPPVPTDPPLLLGELPPVELESGAGMLERPQAATVPATRAAAKRNLEKAHIIFMLLAGMSFIMPDIFPIISDI